MSTIASIQTGYPVDIKAPFKTYLADKLSWSLTTISPLSLCNSFVMEESANVEMKGPRAWKAAILTHLENTDLKFEIKF